VSSFSKEQIMTISYTFNGILDTSYAAWEQWRNDALLLCKELGYEANHYSVSVFGKDIDKVRPIGGLPRKMANIQKKNDVIQEMSIMVLPENYSTAMFDYIITLSRYRDFITAIINQEYEISNKENFIIDILKRNITAEKGEIYEMDISDCPVFYAGKVNSKEDYESLKILKTIL
jgi:hypothetical protein